jgi:hypothetical protein
LFVRLFERSFDSGFAFAQDQGLKKRLTPRLRSARVARSGVGPTVLRTAHRRLHFRARRRYIVGP